MTLTFSTLRMRGIELWDAAVNSAGMDNQRILPTSNAECYPLSPMQREMLFKGLLGQTAGVYVQQLLVEFDATLDLALFREAWLQVMQRHPPLRTTFDVNGNEPLQRVHPSVKLSIELHDLRRPGLEAARGEVNEFLERDRASGFDLGMPPLMRFNLFGLPDASVVFVWTYHHGLLDGRSRLLILKEVFARYEALRGGENLELPALRPFRDYVEWLGRAEHRASEAYWRRTLAGWTTPTRLGIERSSATDQSFPCTQELSLTLAQTKELNEFAAAHGLTFTTLLHGAWAHLLSRYSGQTDVVFGATRAGRHFAAGAGAMIGLFINTVPLRVRIARDLPLLDWLKDLRAVWLELRAHEHTPAQLIRRWCGFRDHQALFETFVVFERHRVADADLRDRPIAGARNFRLLERTGIPLGLSAYGGEQLALRLEYDGNRYADDAAARILEQLAVLLENMVQRPNAKVGDIDLLTEAEKRLLERLNDTRRQYPDQSCVHELFEAQAAKSPDEIAVVYLGERISYRKLNARANRLAHWLRQRGVRPDSLVGVYLERSPAMVVAILGILKAGGAYVPLDRSWPPARLATIGKDAQFCTVLTQKALRGELAGLACPVHCVDDEQDDIQKEPSVNPQRATTPEALAYVIYTSGSTGMPKGVLVEHRGVVNYLSWCLNAYDVWAGRGAPVQSPLAFDLTVTSLLAPLLAGRAVYLAPEQQGAEALGNLLQRERGFSLVKLTPAHLELVQHQLGAALAADRTRAFVIGGENLTNQHVDFWLEHAPGVALFNEYGPTETVVGCCVYRIPPGRRAPGSIPIGRPIANMQAYVLDAERRPVPIGAVGELYIGGVGVARGYVNRPELTAERFVPDPFSAEPKARLYRTGDLARIRADGNLEFLGRLDRQVKVRGFRVELGEIEAALAAHPAIKDLVVTVASSPNHDLALIAYAVPKVGETLSWPDLRRFAAVQLPGYMIPSALVVLPNLPLTPNGKVDHGALPSPPSYASDAQTQRTFPAGSETEARMVRLWEEVLGVRGIGIDDDFFELGGDSLRAAQLVVRVGQEFGEKLSLSTLAEAPTVGGMLAQLSGRRTRSPLVPLQPHGARPPFFCVHGIGGEVISYLALARYFPADQPFYGLEAPAWEWPGGKFPDLETVARRYVEEVRRVQPKGPYYLGGYSSGGTVALAMAHALEAVGETVGLLVVLDHRPFNLKPPDCKWTLGNLFAALQNLFYWLIDDALDAGAGAVLRRIGSKTKSVGHKVQGLLQQSQIALTPRDVIDTSALPPSAVAFIASHLEALLKFVPTPFKGRVSVHRSRARPLFRIEAYDLGWSALAGAVVDVNVIPGSHDNLLKEPRVRRLARDVAQCLRAAQDNGEVYPVPHETTLAGPDTAPASADWLAASGVSRAEATLSLPATASPM